MTGVLGCAGWAGCAGDRASGGGRGRLRLKWGSFEFVMVKTVLAFCGMIVIFAGVNGRLSSLLFLASKKAGGLTIWVFLKDLFHLLFERFLVILIFPLSTLAEDRLVRNLM